MSVTARVGTRCDGLETLAAVAVQPEIKEADLKRGLAFGNMEVIDQRDRRNWQSVGCSKMDDAEQKDKGVGKDSETAHSVLLAAPIDEDYYKIEHLGDDVEVPYNLNLKVQYYPRPGPSSCWFARPILYYTNKEGEPLDRVNHLDIG